MTDIAEKIKRKGRGKNLRVLRTAADLTQDALAELTGISTKTIRKYESEDEIPDDKLELFAKALEVPVNFFDRFNFKDAMEHFSNINNFNANDSSTQNGVNNNADEQEITNNFESPKLHEIYSARIEDAKTIGVLEERLRLISEQCTCGCAGVTKETK